MKETKKGRDPAGEGFDSLGARRCTPEGLQPLSEGAS